MSQLKQGATQEIGMNRIATRIRHSRQKGGFFFSPIKLALFQALICLHLPADDGIEFFEKKIRPMLVEHCYECHSGDAKNLKGGLLLESREQLLKGGDTGPAIVAEKPAESLLLQSLRWESLEMPPKGKLADRVVRDFERWLSMGAPWPQSDSTPMISREKDYDWKQLKESHWAFRPIRQSTPPKILNSELVKNEIDCFVFSKLEAKQMDWADPAGSGELVRRIYFDLIGLPPTPEQADEFFSSYKKDPDGAVKYLVDKLLASPEYGERWGRHWLDVARYSDGFGGFNDNAAMNDAWRYRDWVVAAFNQDLNFRDFLVLQIAGDLKELNESSVATGFLALGPTYKSDGGDPDSVAQAKGETLDDRIDTLSRGLLGITASCSRCHDHKFDPIPQLDYYSLAGVFNNTTVHSAPLATESEVNNYNRFQQLIKDKNKQIQEHNKKIKAEKRAATEGEKISLQKMQEELDALKKSAPAKFPTAHSLRDSGSGNMKVAIRGNLRRTGDEAPRRFFRIIAGETPPLYQQGSGRLELANSIVDPKNPLTARVFVNRIWQHHFGQAIVRTPSNFGRLGENPTHPDLLDWLANRLLVFGSIKDIHRLIMNSSTYRMSSNFDQRNHRIDAENRFLWRMNSRRLDVEAWRDALLSVTGELDKKMGGPPIDDINMKRRTLYFKVSRGGDQFQSDEFLRKFDFPLMRATVAKRSISIVPQQYLFMLNSKFMVDRARALANRLVAYALDREKQITMAYRLLFARSPTEKEKQLGILYISQGAEGDIDHLAKYYQILLSCNEFFFVQ